MALLFVSSYNDKYRRLLTESTENKRANRSYLVIIIYYPHYVFYIKIVKSLEFTELHKTNKQYGNLIIVHYRLASHGASSSRNLF